MKDHNGIKIIGIDHGYGNMKTANACFPTGLIVYDQEPTFKQNLLIYDGRYYIAYYCPKCRRKLPGYAMMNACDQCGTFFDWGKREPVIEVARSVRWDGAGVPTAAAYYELEG